jgi:hypothetical protein
MTIYTGGAMEGFLTKEGDVFLWKQPKVTSRKFVLCRDEKEFGTLEFRSMWGTLAWSKDPIQDWSFKRVGFLSPHITVRMCNTDSDYALFDPKVFGGGMLHTPDGRPYRWEPLNNWHTKWRFTDKKGTPILSFEQDAEEFKLSDMFSIQAAVCVETSRITNLEFSLFVNLGFYLAVLNVMDSSAAAAAAAASSM